MLKDVVFDVRTGYHVTTADAGSFDNHPLGEGNGSVFSIIRCLESELPEMYGVDINADTGTSEIVPVIKLALDVHLVLREAYQVEGKLSNVYTIDTLAITNGSLEDKMLLDESCDTHKNALLTVGTSKTYSTGTAATTAASSGDVVAMYAGGTANVYTESIVVNTKNITLCGTIDSMGVTIKGSGGNFAVILGAAGYRSIRIYNLTIDCGASTSGIYGYSVYARDLTIKGAGTYGVLASAHGTWKNITSYGHTYNIASDTSRVIIYSSTAAKAGSYNFYGTGALDMNCVECLALDSGTENFYNGYDVMSSNNWSDDATAPGSGNSNTASLSDCVDPDNDDYRLKVGTTSPLKGFPAVAVDAYGNVKKTEGDIFPGSHDPDPVVEDFPERVSVLTTDTVDGEAGLYENPDESIVKENESYGYNQTGTLTFVTPDAPSWNGDPSRSGSETIVIPVTAADETNTIQVAYRKINVNTWTLGNTRVGSGDITQAGLDNGNEYYVIFWATENGVPSEPVTEKNIWVLASEPSNAKVSDLKNMIQTRVNTLLSGYSMSLYDMETPNSVHGNHVVMELMLSAGGGEQKMSGYNGSLTLKAYYSPQYAENSDTLDDVCEALVDGLHAHSETDESVGWSWMYTSFIFRNPVRPVNTYSRVEIMEFTFTAKEL